MKKILVAISLAFVSASLHAAEYTVNLVTVGAENQSMVFEPGYLKINKGDLAISNIEEDTDGWKNQKVTESS